MLRNNASGPEIDLSGRILDGLLPGKHRNRPEGRFRCFPGSSPAKIRPGRPISGPEALSHNIKYSCSMQIVLAVAKMAIARSVLTSSCAVEPLSPCAVLRVALCFLTYRAPRRVFLPPGPESGPGAGKPAPGTGDPGPRAGIPAPGAGFRPHGHGP